MISILQGCSVDGFQNNTQKKFFVDLTAQKWHIKQGFSDIQTELNSFSSEYYIPIKNFPVIPNKIFNIKPEKRINHFFMTADFHLEPEILESS
ncbi:MAG: hypothetical protein OEZ34_06005 [Spirochaetia bacterium]|nr:hypothetical protein [Spirochaetia bacterium]